MSESRLSPQQNCVLVALNELTSPREMYVGFAALSDATEMERREVRRRVRILARSGLAEYCRGLWTEDGEPRGAGYAITAAGRAKIEGQS